MSLKGPKFRTLALIAGVIALALGIYLAFFQTRGFVKTTATIVSIREERSDASDDPDKIATVEYTADGRTYTEDLDTFGAGYKVGKTLTVYYDPSDPSEVRGGRGPAIYLIVVGLLLTVGTILSELRGKRALTEMKAACGETSYGPSVLGEERELYFLTDLGTPKFGHRIEDAERRVLYEARMTKFTLSSPYGFDFIDHEHGVTRPHLIGHVEESHWDTFLIDDNSTFTFDGEDVWQHLKRNGIDVKTSIGAGDGRGVGLTLTIYLAGTQIAKAISTSHYVHEEDAEEKKLLSKISSSFFYRIWTKEQNLDLLFLTLVAFARSGAGDASGGNYGALTGTVKDLAGKLRG